MPMIVRKLTRIVSRVESHRIGPWVLAQKIHDGRYSLVFRARPADRDANLPADYAIKIARSSMHDGELARRLIRREIAIGRKLSHSHVVPLLDGDPRGEPAYCVMPYLEGVTLARVLQKIPRMPPFRAFWIARQIAGALAALHEAGWQHADIKPANIHLSPSGHATLLDLGLAQPLERTTDRHEPLVGTVEYAAPEQFSEPAEIGATADIYGLGIVLREMLTGQRPSCNHPDDGENVRELPTAARRMLGEMLAERPELRPNASQLHEKLIELEIASLKSRGSGPLTDLA
jgi:serine/threonine protein kinase